MVAWSRWTATPTEWSEDRWGKEKSSNKDEWIHKWTDKRICDVVLNFSSCQHRHRGRIICKFVIFFALAQPSKNTIFSLCVLMWVRLKRLYVFNLCEMASIVSTDKAEDEIKFWTRLLCAAREQMTDVLRKRFNRQFSSDDSVAREYPDPTAIVVGARMRS